MLFLVMLCLMWTACELFKLGLMYQIANEMALTHMTVTSEIALMKRGD